MPYSRKLTEDELLNLANNGIDPELYRDKEVELLTDEEAKAEQEQQVPTTSNSEEMGTGEAVIKSLRQKGGSLASAGAGALALGRAAAMLPIPHPLGKAAASIVGAIVGAGIGGFGGQLGQEALEGEELAAKLKAEEEAAHAQHPVATGVSDFTAGMVLSGGSLSPSTAARGSRAIVSRLLGNKLSEEAAKDAINVATQAGIMPAISSGISLARTGELPPLKDLAFEAAGGALFAKPSRLGEWAGRVGERKAEPLKNETPTETTEIAQPEKPVNIWKETDGNGRYVIGDDVVKTAYKRFYSKVDEDKFPDAWNNPDYLRAVAEYNKNTNISLNDKRERLHELWDKVHSEPKVEEAPKKPVVPEKVKKPEPTKYVKVKPISALPDDVPVVENVEAVKPIEGVLPTEETVGNFEEIEANRKFVEESNKKAQEAEEARKLKEALEEAGEEAKGKGVIPLPSIETRRAALFWDNTDPKIRSMVSPEHANTEWDAIPEDAKAKIIDTIKSIAGTAPPKEHSFADYVLPREFYHKLRIGDNTPMPSNTMHNWLRNTLNEKSKNWKMLQDVGLSEFLNSKESVTPKEVHDFLNSKIKVEVKTFSGVDSGLYKQEKLKFGQLQHDMETMIPGWFQKTAADKQHALQNLHEDDLKIFRDWMDQHKQLYNILKEEENVLDPVHWSGVSPKTEEQMKGYVEIAVVKPIDEPKYQGKGNPVTAPEAQFPSSHNFPPNTLAFVRGHMEGDTFFIIEVQSDWAQDIKQLKEMDKEGFARPSDRERRDKQMAKRNDPLLAHYERLALKAAIEHAKKSGAKKIAIQDYKSATMTEGHDSVRTAVKPLSIEQVIFEQAIDEQLLNWKNMYKKYDVIVHEEMSNKFGEDWKAGKYVKFQGDVYRVDKPESNFGHSSDVEIAKELQPYMDKGGNKIPQEGGMRLHYGGDSMVVGANGEVVKGGFSSNAEATRWAEKNIARNAPEYPYTVSKGKLNDVMAELTGDEGKIESFGEHKMAYDKKGKTKRSDLIFKNADGTPKTDVTARVFDISKPNERLSTKMSGILADRVSSDHLAYKNLQAKMADMMKQGDTNSPEFQQVWKDLEAIKNKHGGMPPREDVNVTEPTKEDIEAAKVHLENNDLESYVKTNAGNINDALKIIANGNSKWSELASKLKLDKAAKNTPLHFDEESPRSWFLGNRIVIGGKKGMEASIIHEALHSGTMMKMPAKWRNLEGQALKDAYTDYIENGDNESIKEILRCYFQAIDHFKAHDGLFGANGAAGNPDASLKTVGVYGYELSNIDEFIAGALSHEDFIAELNNAHAGKTLTVWSRLMNAISKLLGFDVNEQSLLARTLKPIDILSRQERPEGLGWDRFNAEAGSKPTEDPVKKTGFSFIPAFTSRVDKIARKFNDAVGQMVTDKLHKFHGEYDIKRGQYGNSFIPLVDASKLNQEQLTKVYKHNHEISLFGKTDVKLSREEKAFSEVVKKHFRSIGEDIQKEGPKIRLESDNLRLMKLKDEGYFPSVLSRNVAYEWAENQNSKLAHAFDKAYVDHQVKQGMGREEALETLANYKSALGNQVEPDVKFNAIRKAEGNGLPWELVDQNITSAVTRYSDRAARDVAFYKHLQSDPKIRKALALVDEQGHRIPANAFPEINPINSAEEVRAAMRSVYGIDIPRNPVFMALARAAGNTVMGVGTAARNLTTIPGIAITYAKAGQFKYMWKAIKHMNDSRVRALESGSVKPNFSEAFDAAGYVLDDPNPLVNYLNKYSAFMRKYQGRDLSDRLEGEYLYSLGELISTDNIAKAQKGDVEARAFIRRFGDLIDGGPERLFKGKITPDDVKRLSKRFVDATRGTYSAEGLPSWALEGELAPFAALSKFSIEKSNTVWKDVIEPAKAGNYAPLLKYALASLGVGALIEKMNEELSNKRGSDPTISETLQDPSVENLLAKTIGLAQLASFAGIMSDGAKAAMQMYQGKELRYNQPLSLPLYTLVTDTILGNASDAVSAIQDGEDPFEVLGSLVTTIASQSIQTMRYVDANIIHPEDAKRKEKFRDVSIFQQMEGGKADPKIKVNKFENARGKEFKKTADIEEARRLLPGLIQEAIRKSKGDPYELQRRLKSLKSNSYQTMPSFETVPASFLKYINRLKNTQGEEAAAQRLEEYLRQRQINKIKSSMVP